MDAVMWDVVRNLKILNDFINISELKRSFVPGKVENWEDVWMGVRNI